MASFKFRVVLCRIRLFPTLISKIKWPGCELPLGCLYTFWPNRTLLWVCKTAKQLTLGQISFHDHIHWPKKYTQITFNSGSHAPDGRWSVLSSCKVANVANLRSQVQHVRSDSDRHHSNRNFILNKCYYIWTVSYNNLHSSDTKKWRKTNVVSYYYRAGWLGKEKISGPAWSANNGVPSPSV